MIQADHSRFEVPSLVNDSISAFEVLDGVHRFLLRSGARVSSGGLWRLLVQGQIVATEHDYALRDWRPNSQPMDVQTQERVRAHVLGKNIVDAFVTVPTGDLVINCGTDARLEFIKLNSFLESWEAVMPGVHLLVDAWGQVNQWGKDESHV